MANVDLNWHVRKKVGEVIAGYVDAGETQIGEAKEWWDFMRAVHRNENLSRGSDKGNKDDSGFRVFHIPFSSVFQDALTDQVCAVVTKQEPVMVDVSDEEAVADAKAEFGHRVWNKAKFARKYKQAASESSDTNLSFMRLCPFGSGTGEIEISNHSPEDVIVFPAFGMDLANATAVGHRIYKRQRDVDDARDAKAYYSDKYDEDEDLTEGSPFSQDEGRGDELERAGITDVSGPLNEKDHPVELWDVCVFLDLNGLRKDAAQTEVRGEEPQWYRATIARGDRCLLALEPYPYARPWYFRFSFIPSRIYPPATSVARNLWPAQDAYNQLFSAMYAGAKMAAMPPIFTPEDITKDGQKQTYYGSGDLLDFDAGGGAPWSPAVSPQLAPIPVMLDKLEQIGYRTSGISESTAGASAANKTATANSIEAAGTAVKLESYIETHTEELDAMMDLTMQIAAGDPEAFFAKYNVVPPEMVGQAAQVGGMAPICLLPEHLEGETEWVVSGQSPANSPQAIIQTIQLLLPLAQNPASGVDLYNAVEVWLKHSPLRNAKVQVSREEVAQRLIAGLQAQTGGGMGQVGGDGAVSGPPGLSGAPS